MLDTDPQQNSAHTGITSKTSTAGSTPASRPNLLFVFADQMRAFSCGYRAADPVLTPRLDAFAKQGMTLTHAVSNYPVCSPYRAMLMTGQHPPRNGVWDNCNSSRTCQLDQSTTCFTDVLNSAGYSVGYVGKWHLEAPHEPYVMRPGFEGLVWNEFTPPQRRHGIGYWHGYNTYDNHFEPQYWVGDAPRDARTTFHQWSPEHEADTAIDFLRNAGGDYRRPGAPFALFVSNNPPHTPFNLVPERYVHAYGDATPEELLVRDNVNHKSADEATKKALAGVKNHFAMISGVDEQFGRIIDELHVQGLADNTLVVFTADHGEMMGSHGLMHKNSPYEESARVPFIARLPGRIKPGSSDDVLLGAPDVMPTVLGLLGLTRAISETCQGSDLSWIVSPDNSSTETAVERSRQLTVAPGRGPAAGRPECALYYRQLPDGGRLRGLFTGRYTFVIDSRPGQPPVLYDNHADPFQLINIAIDRPGELRELSARLRVELERVGDDLSWFKF